MTHTHTHTHAHTHTHTSQTVMRAAITTKEQLKPSNTSRLMATLPLSREALYTAYVCVCMLCVCMVLEIT